MASLILPSRRGAQPQWPVEIEQNNPLADGLAALPGFSLDGYDVVRGFRPTLDAGVTRQFGQYGKTLRGTTGADGFKLTTSGGFSGIVPAASKFTIMALVRVATTGSRRIMLGDFDAAGSNESVFIEQQAANTYRFGMVDTGPVLRTIIGGSVSVGWHWIEFGWDGVNIQASVDGFVLAPVGAPTQRRAGNDMRALRAGAFTSLGFDGDMAFLGMWKRYTPSEERLAIRNNPWQLYRPLQRRIWVAVAGGGAATATPSGAASLAASGDVSASGNAATSPAGAQAASATGTVAATGGATTAPSGTAATGSAGTTAAIGAATASPTGSQVVAEAGTVSANSGGSISVAPAGAASTASAGTLTVITSSVASAPGAQAQAQAGVVTAGDPALQAKGGGMPAYYVYDSSTEEEQAAPPGTPAKNPKKATNAPAVQSTSTPSLTKALVDRFIANQVSLSSDTSRPASQLEALDLPLMTIAPVAVMTSPQLDDATTFAQADAARRFDDEEAIALLMLA